MNNLSGFRTSVDIYKLDDNGNKVYIDKGGHNANAYGSRITIMETFFDVARVDDYHKPFKNSECFKVSPADGTSKWGSYDLIECELAPGFTEAETKNVTSDEIQARFNNSNGRRALWFAIGNGGAKINTITSEIPTTFDFDTTLFNCIPFRLTEEPLVGTEMKKYGVGLKMRFRQKTRGTEKTMYGYFLKKVDGYTKFIEGPNGDVGFEPDKASTNTTDSKYVMPDEKADHEMEIGVTFTGTIEPAEVVEYYNFVNSTSAGAFVDELGLVISKIKIGRDDTFGSDESHEQVDWNDAELFTHYESNRLDQSKSRSTSTVEYNLYFN